MKTVFLALLMTLSLACGGAQTTLNQGAPPENWAATDQMANVHQFVTEGASRAYAADVNHLTIQYSIDVDSTHWAICNFDAAGNPVISLAPDVSKQSAVFQEELVFHELGHCILWRGHNGAISIPLGGPASLMYGSLISESQYSNNRSTYLDELFSVHGSMKPGSGF